MDNIMSESGPKDLTDDSQDYSEKDEADVNYKSTLYIRKEREIPKQKPIVREKIKAPSLSQGPRQAPTQRNHASTVHDVPITLFHASQRVPSSIRAVTSP